MKAWRSLRVAFFLAGRSLVRGNIGIGLLTITMMVLIFMNLMFLPSLIDSASMKVSKQLVSNITSDIFITSAGTVPDIDQSKELVKQISSTAGVNTSSSVYRVGNQVSFGSNTGAWGIDSVDPANFNKVIDTPNQLLEGSNLAPGDIDSILLGVGIAGADQSTQRDYALSLQKVHVGDKVTVALINGKKHDFKVKGIYQTGFPSADTKGYITVGASDLLLPQTIDRATAVYVKLKDGADRNEVIKQLSADRSGLKFQTPTDVAGAIKDQTDTFAIINNILKIISLLVAAITIFIITYVDLVNRSRQIGIERAIGIKSSSIVISYVLKAIVYSLIGTILGTLVFLFVAVPIVARHPFHFPVGPVTLIVVPASIRLNAAVLIVVAVISALIPAYRSVRIRILKAIWG